MSTRIQCDPAKGATPPSLSSPPGKQTHKEGTTMRKGIPGMVGVLVSAGLALAQPVVLPSQPVAVLGKPVAWAGSESAPPPPLEKGWGTQSPPTANLGRPITLN